VETPFSWVVLTDRHAYKFKKPVDRGESRLRTAEQRRQASADEVWLNRRLAEGVYLGVVAINRDGSGDLRVGGAGTPIEWAVKMRRLPQSVNMRWLLQNEDLGSSRILALAERLAQFYQSSPPQSDRVSDFVARLRRRIDDDRLLSRQTPAKLRKQAVQARRAQHAYLEGAQMVLHLRVCDGRIVDGHGDLRPEHVFFERLPAIIGCVEYSAERRRRDALDDLSGLTLECRRVGRDDVAETLTTKFRACTGDDAYPHLEAFYRSLHACERAGAAVAAISGGEVRDAAVRRQLAAAESWINEAHRDLAGLA
jgi:aminoglycoside phosphotransferase family enzyme